jgi:hypothetical protein
LLEWVTAPLTREGAAVIDIEKDRGLVDVLHNVDHLEALIPHSLLS